MTSTKLLLFAVLLVLIGVSIGLGVFNSVGGLQVSAGGSLGIGGLVWSDKEH